MSDAVTATGILVQRSTLPVASPAVYATVAEITEVTPGGMSRNKIETSTHNDGTESHVLGVLRQSDPSLKVNYVASETTHMAVLSDIAGNVKASWRILFPSKVRRTGDAFVQAFAFDNVPMDGKQGATITLTWAGPVVEDVAP
jgi:Lambda phage tail tube protein, TTP